MARIYRCVYQDKALNKRTIKIPAFGFGEAIPKAYEGKKAEEKLLKVEFVEEETDVK